MQKSGLSKKGKSHPKILWNKLTGDINMTASKTY